MDCEELGKIKAHQVLTCTHTQKLTLLLLIFIICHSTGHEGEKNPTTQQKRSTDLSEIQFQAMWCFLNWKFHFQVYLLLGFAS